MGEVEEQVPKFEIGSIDWSSAKGARHKTDSDTPHFYSNSRGMEENIQENIQKRLRDYLLCFQTSRWVDGLRRSRF